MSAPPAEAAAPVPARQDDPGERGSLHVDRAVLRKIAEHAAVQVPGTARTRRGASAKLSGPDRELRIRLDLPLRYPDPVRPTVRQVRTAVREELSRLAGAEVLSVEVTVSALVPAPERERVE